MSKRKKIVLMATFVCMMVTAFVQINTHEIVASEYYTFSCSANEYEVSYIRDDGNFDKHSCYSDFASANAKMKELGGDYVVRSANSLSPTKIVSMNSGLVYSYPARSGKSTMNLYEDPEDRSIYTKQTYITNHWEMTYHETERVLKNGQFGMVKISMNGFEGYADLEYTDLVPSKYIEKGIAIYLGGNDTTGANEQAFKVIPRQKYYEAVSDGNYVDLVLTYHQTYPKKNSLEPVTYTSKVGPAPDFMQSGQRYYSSDGIHFYSDRNLSNYVGTNYNYYQYLPLRSTTNISAPQFEAFLKAVGKSGSSVMKDHAQTFIDAQNKYGCNALLVYALACHESDYGTSYYAVERYNLFGWNAFDSDPNQASRFESINQAVEEQMGINLRGYVDITDGRFFNSSFGNKGSGMNVKYASDPYWGVKIAAIAYNIDKYANNHNGNLSDYNQYDLALINTFDIDVKAGPGNSTNTLYKTGYGGDYQKDFIVITLGQTGNYTKIQSTNAIDDNGNIKTHRTPVTTGNVNPISTYDFSKSIGYVETKHLVALNYDQKTPELGDYISELSKYEWSDNLLSLAGKSYIENKLVAKTDDVKIQFELIGENNNYTFDLTPSIANKCELSFEGTIDLSEVKADTYTMRISTKYLSDDVQDGFDIKDQALLSSKTINDKLYSFLIKNSLNSLIVSDVKLESNQLRQSVDKIALVDNKLSIEGIGLLDGINILNQDDIQHKLIFVDKNDVEKVYEFILNSEDAGGFSLNDGYTYKYAKFTGEIDLANIPMSSYSIRIEVSVSGVSKQSNLFSTYKQHNIVIGAYDDVVYKINTNQIYAFNFELDIMKNNLDFSEISKPTLSNSLFDFNYIKENDGVLNIDAFGMIFGTDYPNSNKTHHQVYLVGDDGEVYTINTQTYACEIDYAEIMQSKNDLSNICFSSSTDFSDIPNGHYRMYLGITSDGYNDIVEITNTSNRKIGDYANGNKTVTFITSPVRNRIELEVRESD